MALESFLCPISQEVMEDPVVASDGHSYDRKSIQRWFEHKCSSPVTNAWLSSSQLVPNHTLRQAIREYKTYRGTTLAAFRCPINKHVMKDPIVASDGYSYDRESVKVKRLFGLVVKKTKSPITKLRLNVKTMLPNHALKQAIVEMADLASNTSRRRISQHLSPPAGSFYTVRNDSRFLVESGVSSQDLSPTARPPSHPPTVFRVLRKSSVFWSPDLEDAMPPEFNLEPDALIVAVPVRKRREDATFVAIDGDALGFFVDKAYVILEVGNNHRFLEKIEPIPVSVQFRVQAPIAVSLWPTAAPVDLLGWRVEGELIDSEAVVYDHDGRAFHRCRHTKCWLYVDEDNAEPLFTDELS
ncbi:hypothetical protein LEN26_018362 [Aphanomyces euteiches]|nr:hypothetical protein LEN26_018362 [Aphanomyces euteiches]